MSAVQAIYPSSMREEELKNRVAAEYFGKYDCARIVGNIDFCVSFKQSDGTGYQPVPDANGRSAHSASILWTEAKNHPTDVHRMLAQLILTIGRAMCPHAAAAVAGRPPYQGDIFAGLSNSNDEYTVDPLKNNPVSSASLR